MKPEQNTEKKLIGPDFSGLSSKFQASCKFLYGHLDKVSSRTGALNDLAGQA